MQTIVSIIIIFAFECIIQISVKQDVIEKELHERTMRICKDYIMLGAPEVLQMGKNMIKLIKAKRVLDIGSLLSHCNFLL